MLVLTRGPGERILLTVPGLAEPLVVTVVRMAQHAVRLGIDAPPEVAIRRAELPLAAAAPVPAEVPR